LPDSKRIFIWNFKICEFNKIRNDDWSGLGNESYDYCIRKIIEIGLINIEETPKKKVSRKNCTIGRMTRI
jgi:hypothetical protein